MTDSVIHPLLPIRTCSVCDTTLTQTQITLKYPQKSRVL